MAYIPSSGSVVAFQSDPSQLQASVTGTVNVRGSVTTVLNSSSIITVTQGSVAAAIVSGSVTATQGTNPWLTKQSVIGIVDAGNSTATPLGANASFVGTITDATEFAQISLSSFSDVASGPAGLQLQWSSDGVNFDHIHNDAIASSTFGFLSGGVHNKYYRTAYYNGSIAQATFRMQTYQSKINTPNVFASLDYPLTATDHAQIFKGLLTGKTTAGGGTYVDMKVTPSGAISAAVTAADGDVYVRSNAASTFPVSASIVGTVPVTMTGTGSVITVGQGSVAVAIVSGSITASFTPPANQSVSGTVNVGNFPVTQNVSGSVVATQGTSPWIITGSVQTTVSVGNSSVQLLAGTNAIGSVTTLQGTNPWIITGSVQASLTPAANQSVSGAVTAPAGSVMSVTNPAGSVTAVSATITNNVTVVSSISGGIFPISGSVAAVVTNNVTVVSSLAGGIFPVSGSVAAVVTNFPTTQNVSGSVVATQGTSPWIVAPNNSSMFALQVAGSILATSATVNMSNSSVMLLTSTNVIGSVTTLQGTNPWIITGSVQASLTPAANQSVSGAVTAQAGSIMSVANPAGSVTAVQGTVGGSIIGTVPVTQSGTIISSVISSNPSSLLAGVYAQRNDTVASFLGADLTWRPIATDSAGRIIIKHFAADENRISAQTSVVSTSVTALFSSAVGLRQYVTDIMVANTGTSATLVTFKDGSTSVLGYTIAPAGGGSNIIGMAIPLRTAPAQDFVFNATTASSVLYVTAQGYKAP